MRIYWHVFDFSHLPIMQFLMSLIFMTLFYVLFLSSTRNNISLISKTDEKWKEKPWQFFFLEILFYLFFHQNHAQASACLHLFTKMILIKVWENRENRKKITHASTSKKN